MPRIFLIVLVGSAALGIGCHRRSTVGHQSFTAPIQISAAERDAAEPTVATGPDGGAYLAWVEHDGSNADVLVGLVNRAGALVRPPVRVNPDAGVATAWRGDPPSLAAVPDGTLYITWTARALTPDGNKATNVMLSISRDGGQSFAAPQRINDDSAPSDHGMHSLAVSGDGHVYVAWLDGRNPQPDIGTDASMAGMSHEMPADQKMKHSEGNREIFLAASADGGKTFSANRRVAGQVCPCCKTALALAPDGRIYLSWRQVLPGSFRHIAVASSTDLGHTFSSPTIVSDDNWKLFACPVSGAALDAGTPGHLRVMWYAAGDTGAAGYYQTQSTDNGATFQPRRLFAAGAGRGTPFFLAMSNTGCFGIWEAGDGDTASVQFGLLGSDENSTAAITKVADGATPVAVRTEGQIFVALMVKKGEKRGIALSRTAL